MPYNALCEWGAVKMHQRTMRRAFQMHRWNAKRRAIPFLFTFEQWRAWWLTDDRWSKRGRRKGQLVMVRIDDKGAYQPNNVFCTSPAGNAANVSPLKRRAAAMRAAEKRRQFG